MNNSPSKHSAPGRRARRLWLGILAGVVAAILLLAAVYGVLYYQGRTSLGAKGSTLSAPDSLVDAADDDLQRVTYQGVDYAYNKDVISVLFIGVDKKDIAADTSYGQNGQADSLFVAAIDTAGGVTRVIPLSRESMVDVDVFGIGGGYAGVEKTQLCLAYAYGATGQESCENVVRSAKRLLYGVDINAYAAIDLDGLAALTEEVGGVTVTSPEDIHRYGLTINKGDTVTLDRKSAVGYVRYRGTDVDANNRRQKRQQQFLSAFLTAAKQQVQKDPTRVAGLYSTARPYLVSNLGLSDLTYLVTNSMGALGKVEYLSIKGDTVMGDQYVEFHPDRTSVYETVLKAFYRPVEK